MTRVTRPLGACLLLSLCLGALLALAGCGEDAEVQLDVTVEGESRASVSGSIVGVTGPLSLSLNGGQTVTVAQSGTFAFSGGLFHGTAAQITVSGQPSFGNCVVRNGDHPSVAGDIVVRVYCIAAGAVQDPLNLDLATSSVGTTAGNGTPAFIDALSTLAAFNFPIGTATDGERLWIADSGNHRIRQVELATGNVTTVVGDGTTAILNLPGGVTTDGNILWIADANNNRVRRFELATGALTTVLTGLVAPADVTTDGRYVFVLERLANQVRRYDPASGAAPVLATGFNQPTGITHDGTWLYVADTGNNLVSRVDPNTGASSPYVTGLNFPRGVTTDGTWLYISNSGAQTMLKTDLATGSTTLLAGTAGSPGAIDGAASGAQFNSPYGGVPVNSKLYIAGGTNHTVRVIQ